MKQILLIGEAPGKSGAPGEEALSGRAGRRLAGLMGVSFEEYLKRTERWNVLPSWPGKAAGNGAAWPRDEARSAAGRLASFFWPRPMVIFLGRRVADAFGERDTSRWFVPHWNSMLQWHVYVSPHPSGASRWWNEPHNRREAATFWLGVASHG